MTSTVLNIKISEVETKISGTSSLVNTTVLNAKISEIEYKTFDHGKYITTQKFNKLTVENCKEILKQANLVSKTYFKIN